MEVEFVMRASVKIKALFAGSADVLVRRLLLFALRAHADEDVRAPSKKWRVPDYLSLIAFLPLIALKKSG